MLGQYRIILVRKARRQMFRQLKQTPSGFPFSTHSQRQSTTIVMILFMPPKLH